MWLIIQEFGMEKKVLQILYWCLMRRMSQGVIEYGICDHYIIFCTKKCSRVKCSNHKIIRSRSLKTYSIELLIALNYIALNYLNNLKE